MIYPGKKEFIELAKKGNVIPVYKEIGIGEETPLSAFNKIDDKKFSCLLESVEGGEKDARFSFLANKPSLVFESKGKDICIKYSGKVKRYKTKKDPIYEIKELMKKYRFVKVEGLPRFTGGLVGYMSYDMVRFFEKLPDKNPDDLKAPDSVMLLTDNIIIFDHVKKVIQIVANTFVTKNAPLAYDKAVKAILSLEMKLKASVTGKKNKSKPGKMKITSNITQKKFENMVEKAKQYIRKGDIIQAVLSQRLKTKVKGDTFNIYKALRKINPSPYMFYLNLGNLKLIGSSPEIMVRTEDGICEVRPIAGTRPRGRDKEEDMRLEKELLKDPKERAEHIMLVDLGRNDIGRVCDFKTVKVEELMGIERYSHVMHIVSDVCGNLKKDKDVYDVIRATFPAGTVTGAPKIRAMEIIDELEPLRRGPYAGSVGYFSFSHNEDFCITIRTILIKNGYAYIQAGAGIVADSKPEKEYKETLNKARALVKAIEMAEKNDK